MQDQENTSASENIKRVDFNLTGDALITYGFKRVIEEMKLTRKALEKNNDLREKEIMIQSHSVKVSETMEKHFETLNSILANAYQGFSEVKSYIDHIKANTLTASLNVIRLLDLARGKEENKP